MKVMKIFSKPCVTFFCLSLSLSASMYAGEVENARTGIEYEGPFALQDAIDAANNGDTLKLKGEFFGNFNNENKSLTLQGSKKATLDGLHTGSVFTVIGTATTVMTFINLTFENGATAGNGGGISNGVTGFTGPQIVLDNCKVAFNGATGSGGGIYNTGTMHITRSTVKNNAALVSGGGVYTTDSAVNIIGTTEIEKNTSGSGGGAFFNTGSTGTMVDCEIEKNVSNVDGGGGIYNLSSTLFLFDCDVYRNTAATQGGGIFNQGASGATGNLILDDTRVHANTANGSPSSTAGGGIFNSAFANLTTQDDTDVEHNTPNDIIDQ